MPGRVNNRFGFAGALMVSVLLLAGLWTVAAGSFSAPQEEASPPHREGMEAAKRVLGPNACGECHIAELESWNKSAHALGYAEMHRSAEAKEIAEKLGVRRVKREATCLRCHYSEQAEDDKAQAIAGVSCESCHGPARDWMPIHDNYGPGATKTDESVDHKAGRRLQALNAGMHRPDDLYHLASSCYRCHVLDDSNVVEKGGHPVDADFELLAYSQGEVRHNFMASDGKSNALPSAERRRKIYVLGQFLDLEFSLRALQSVSGPGALADALKARVKTSESRLKKIAEVAESAELKAVLEICAGLELNPASSDLTPAIDKIARLAKTIANGDASDFGAIDALLPGPEAVKGKAQG